MGDPWDTSAPQDRVLDDWKVYHVNGRLRAHDQGNDWHDVLIITKARNIKEAADVVSNFFNQHGIGVRDAYVREVS